MEEQERDEKKQEDKVVEEKRKAYEFVRSNEWRSIKATLLEKIMLVDSCSVLDENLTVQQAGERALVSRGIVKMISEWIAEIEGDASSFPEFIKLIEEKKKDNLIFKTE